MIKAHFYKNRIEVIQGQGCGISEQKAHYGEWWSDISSWGGYSVVMLHDENINIFKFFVKHFYLN